MKQNTRAVQWPYMLWNVSCCSYGSPRKKVCVFNSSPHKRTSDSCCSRKAASSYDEKVGFRDRYPRSAYKQRIIQAQVACNMWVFVSGFGPSPLHVVVSAHGHTISDKNLNPASLEARQVKPLLPKSTIGGRIVLRTYKSTTDLTPSLAKAVKRINVTYYLLSSLPLPLPWPKLTLNAPR